MVDEDTLDRAATYWLPLIRRCSSNSRCPVVLVGNKIDLVDYSTIEVWQIKFRTSNINPFLIVNLIFFTSGCISNNERIH